MSGKIGSLTNPAGRLSGRSSAQIERMIKMRQAKEQEKMREIGRGTRGRGKLGVKSETRRLRGRKLSY